MYKKIFVGMCVLGAVAATVYYRSEGYYARSASKAFDRMMSGVVDEDVQEARKWATRSVSYAGKISNSKRYGKLAEKVLFFSQLFLDSFESPEAAVVLMYKACAEGEQALGSAMFDTESTVLAWFPDEPEEKRKELERVYMRAFVNFYARYRNFIGKQEIKTRVEDSSAVGVQVYCWIDTPALRSSGCYLNLDDENGLWRVYGVSTNFLGEWERIVSSFDGFRTEHRWNIDDMIDLFREEDTVFDVLTRASEMPVEELDNIAMTGDTIEALEEVRIAGVPRIPAGEKITIVDQVVKKGDIFFQGIMEDGTEIEIPASEIDSRFSVSLSLLR